MATARRVPSRTTKVRRRPASRAHARPAKGNAPTARLRKICLALPDASEKIAWGEPTWRVGGKLFAQMDTHHHGADHIAVWLPMPLGAQEALVEADAERFFVPPYVGHRGWVGVRIDRSPDWGVVAGLVEEAYRLIAPPRIAAKRAAKQKP
jgi:hypothetical protein